MAKSYRCTECGTLLMNHAEMQEHAEDLGHQGFEEATEEIKIVYCCDCGKDCRNAVAQQMHTRNTGHSQFQDTRPEMKKAVPQAVGGAAPMDVDDSTVGAQALGMLPGIEALDEPGDTEGQSKMVRILDNSGNMVAAVFKWAAKEQKWNKHKEIVDEDQAADPEEIQKAFAAANAELLGPLMEMGFPEERCKKALLLTGNDSVEHGIQWLTEHVEDPLADAPMTIAQVKKALKPKMTPEEKAAKAAALQRKAKAERERREALEAIDREKRKRGATQPPATRPLPSHSVIAQATVGSFVPARTMEPDVRVSAGTLVDQRALKRAQSSKGNWTRLSECASSRRKRAKRRQRRRSVTALRRSWQQTEPSVALRPKRRTHRRKRPIFWGTRKFPPGPSFAQSFAPSKMNMAT